MGCTNQRGASQVPTLNLKADAPLPVPEQELFAGKPSTLERGDHQDALVDGKGGHLAKCQPQETITNSEVGTTASILDLVLSAGRRVAASLPLPAMPSPATWTRHDSTTWLNDPLSGACSLD